MTGLNLVGTARRALNTQEEVQQVGEEAVRINVAAELAEEQKY